MNLGIDFGSTSTCFSTYDHATGAVLPCQIDNTDMIDSIACINFMNRLFFGEAAKDTLRNDPSSRGYKAFKMLLTEKDAQKLAKWGYDSHNTPQRIAERFLANYIRRISDNNLNRIDKLVICVPELWTSDRAIRKGLLDGRAILRDACKTITKQLYGQPSNVQVISEPAAASAFFAHKYKNTYGTDFQGHVLIIDYGGGTLDLTLTEVMPRGDNSAEIAVRHQYGVGENEEQEIGKGGIAYMDRVLALALRDQNIPADFSASNTELYQATALFERYLKSQSLHHRTIPEHGNIFDDEDSSEDFLDALDLCLDDFRRLEDNHNIFTQVRYQNRLIPITYSHLYQAFAQVVEPSLTECLNHMVNWMDIENQTAVKHRQQPPYQYQDANAHNFHIVLVGGFGKFLLVQRSVQEFFRCSAANDRRFSLDFANDREYAVSKGAALLAADQIVLHHTAPYGIGITYKDSSNSQVIYRRLAIKCRQHYQPDEPYWIGSHCILNVRNSIDSFLIGHDSHRNVARPAIMTPEMQSRIDEAFQDLLREYALVYPERCAQASLHRVGFSMDPSGVLSFLLQSDDRKIMVSKELALLSHLFDISESEEVPLK